jgi:hypothetical protein
MLPLNTLRLNDIDRRTTGFLDERKVMWGHFKAFLLVEGAYRPKYSSIRLQVIAAICPEC